MTLLLQWAFISSHARVDMEHGRYVFESLTERWRNSRYGLYFFLGVLTFDIPAIALLSLWTA